MSEQHDLVESSSEEDNSYISSECGDDVVEAKAGSSKSNIIPNPFFSGNKNTNKRKVEAEESSDSESFDDSDIDSDDDDDTNDEEKTSKDIAEPDIGIHDKSDSYILSRFY